MNNMTLGKKIALGFGALLLISALPGGLAVFSMKSVQTSAQKLATEYVPESEIAGKLESGVWSAQLAVRSYGLTYDEGYLVEARKGMEEIHKRLQAAQKLSGKHPALVELREHLEEFAPALKTYEDLIARTESRNKEIGDQREKLNQTAADFIDNIEKLISSQNSKLEQEIKRSAEAPKLQERREKLMLCGEIRMEGNLARIAVFKSQVLRDPSLIESGLKNFETMDKKFEALLAMLQVQEDIAELNKVKKDAYTYRDSMKAVLSVNVALTELAKERVKAALHLQALVRETSNTGMQRTVESATSSIQKLATSSWILIVGLIVALVVGFAIAWFIIRSMNRVLKNVATALDEGSSQVASAACQVSSSSQSLAEGANEQAASLEETSSSLEEMSSMTNRNSENAVKAKDLASQARSAAETGSTDMQTMNTSMEAIKASSDDIAKIIKTIDEIAFQTNILALNAAVEAARAGEAGMGFAVVADEVRNLAQRCAQSAKETSSKIEGAITKTRQGVEISAKVARGLQEIVAKVRQVDELVGEVASASKEQTQGISQVNVAVGEMDKVTQSNAATAEESASAAEELSAQSEMLKDSVAQLLSLVGSDRNSNGAGPNKSPQARKDAPVPLFVSHPAPGKLKSPRAPQPRPQFASNRAIKGKPSEIPLETEFRDF